MGFVSTFCLISGSSPIAHDELVPEALLDEDPDAFPMVKGALEALRSEQGGGRADTTVIGVTDDEGTELYNDGVGGYAAAVKHVDGLRFIKPCFAGGFFEFGSVTSRTVTQPKNYREQIYIVSYGASIMLMSWAIPILYLATAGRMTLRRLWTLAMKVEGHHDPHNHYVVPGVDYLDVTKGIDQFLRAFVNLPDDEDERLEAIWRIESESEAVEDAKDKLVHEAGYWPWMAADAFPLSPSGTDSSRFTPFPREPLPSAPARPTLSSLPLDVLTTLCAYLPLPSLLALASTNAILRRTVLSSRVARAWLDIEGRCWLPHSVDFGVPDAKKGSIPRLAHLPQPQMRVVDGDVGDWWAYVERCMASGSMRNRKRVWAVAKQLERVADKNDV
ncbi:hypothetical protein JCM10212_006605 [Sporobolomyces blumeae]